MSFFDDAIAGAKSFGSSVGRKTGQMVDVTKLKISAADIRSEIGSYYKAMGKAVYEARKAGGDTERIVTECVRKIDALKDRLDEINRRIAELQKKTACTACGAAVDAKSLYCSRCGAKIEQDRRSAGTQREEAVTPEVITVED